MSDPTGGWAAATTEGLKALRELGGAISEPIREITGMATDHLKIVRFERQVRLADRVRLVMRERGIDRLDRPIPLNTLLPLLEHAGLEENDELQDVWARMLVNAGDTQSATEVRKAFVSILAEMTSLDVKNLATLADASRGWEVILWTHELPHRAQKLNDIPDREPIQTAPLPEHLEISLLNLSRLACIVISNDLNPFGRPMPHHAALTGLGRALVRACTTPTLAP